MQSASVAEAFHKLPRLFFGSSVSGSHFLRSYNFKKLLAQEILTEIMILKKAIVHTINIKFMQSKPLSQLQFQA